MFKTKGKETETVNKTKKDELRALLDAMFDEGMSEQEILNTFGKTMDQKKEDDKKAEEKKAAAAKRKQNIKTLREVTIIDMLDYFTALGLVKDEKVEEWRSNLTDMFEEFESEVETNKDAATGLEVSITLTNDDNKYKSQTISSPREWKATYQYNTDDKANIEEFQHFINAIFGDCE